MPAVRTAITSFIVARVKFEPESSSSHESSSSQFFFHIFFPIILCDYTVNIIVKKNPIVKINISSLVFNWRQFSSGDA